jgi:hypothetical protein
MAEAWGLLGAQAAPPGFAVHYQAVARALGLPGNTLSVYLRRARAAVIRCHGSRLCRELFRHWPGSLFDREERP